MTELIGEDQLWQHLFFVLKLSKDNMVDFLYRAKENKKNFYYKVKRFNILFLFLVFALSPD